MGYYKKEIYVEKTCSPQPAPNFCTTLSDSIVAEFLRLNLNVAAKGEHEVAEVVPAAPVAIQQIGTAVASTSASEAISVAAKDEHEVAEVVPAAPVAIQQVATVVASTSASEAISG
ncbi:hypothetical protein JYU34_010374 [Plutella xylostella]|uniref:Uncharacterized protein n=1 Tax=Plutella xylostella TaxID=51655 RepID=A0ABQ7QIB0_PLUXY|nr:hypothetical protein JYU34_010374 [Plutella xylostella]